MELQEHVPV